MKYSIRGNLQTNKSLAVISLINSYTLWRLHTNTIIDRQTKEPKFTFEAWVSIEKEKNDLFNSLREHVTLSGENISWHECTHDQNIPLPCEIIETYEGG